jgi:hypothetical protein
MKIQELMDILQAMDPEKAAFVALFKADGTAEVFEIEEVGGHEGHAQLEICEEELDDEEPVAEATEPA